MTATRSPAIPAPRFAGFVFSAFNAKTAEKPANQGGTCQRGLDLTNRQIDGAVIGAHFGGMSEALNQAATRVRSGTSPNDPPIDLEALRSARLETEPFA